MRRRLSKLMTEGTTIISMLGLISLLTSIINSEKGFLRISRELDFSEEEASALFGLEFIDLPKEK